MFNSPSFASMVSGNIRLMKDWSTLHTVRAYQMHTVQLRSTTNSGSLTHPTRRYWSVFRLDYCNAMYTVLIIYELDEHVNISRAVLLTTIEWRKYKRFTRHSWQSETSSSHAVLLLVVIKQSNKIANQCLALTNAWTLPGINGLPWRPLKDLAKTEVNVENMLLIEQQITWLVITKVQSENFGLVTQRRH